MINDKCVSLLTRISALYEEEVTEGSAPLYQVRTAALLHEIDAVRETLDPEGSVLDAEADAVLSQERLRLERYLKGVTQLRTAGEQKEIIEQTIKRDQLIKELKEQKC